MASLQKLIVRLLFCLIAIYSLSAMAMEPKAPLDSDTVNEEPNEVLQNIPPEALAKLSPSQIAELIKTRLQGNPTAAQLIIDKQIIVPGIVFGTFAIIAFLLAYFSYRKRQDLLNLVQEAIKSGHPLPNSFLDSIENRKKPTADSDLRKSVILIALGLSSIPIIYNLADTEQRSAAAVGILPFLMGIAYLFLWWIAKSKPASSSEIAE